MTRQLYGRAFDDAVVRMGSLGQGVSIETSTITNGSAAGTRRIRIVNGGLDLEVLPDRGLDLGQLRVGGVPLAWISPTGFVRPDPYASDGAGFARAFGGGLLTTCGLLNFGPAAEDGGAQHPMHGRYSSLAADVVRADVVADELVVEGVITESTVFGAHLELRRRISSPIGSSTVRIADLLTNRGAEPIEPMVLYHLNFGWPLVDEGTVLRTPSTEVRPRDAQAAAGADSWDVFPAPTASYPEQVFEHVLPERRDVDIEIASPRGLRAHVRFDTAQLPGLIQWRVAAAGHHVLGVEPASVPTILGRSVARERGLLAPLAPGATLALGVEVEVAGALG